MSRAAVPDYVGDDFAECPPGHCFNLYFPVWRTDWQIDKTGKTGALRRCLKLNSGRAALDALLARQQALSDAVPAALRLVLDARSTSPFATGLGLEHPIENGFAFLSPYGLPYLAGSGVKGVLRRAAEELRDDGEISQSAIDALFGHEDANDARRGALTCWDVFPKPPGDALAVEIMTPHFGHYYQDGDTPHDAGKPNPIPFLAVPAGSQFHFVITCEPGLLNDAVADWQTTLNRIVEHAFDWLGFGAKTAVGYGAMTEDGKAKQERLEQAAKQRDAKKKIEDEIRLANLPPEERAWEEHSKTLDVFRQQFDAARTSPYKPGSAFDSQRNEFMKAAQTWEDSRSRMAASEILNQTLSKAWGLPSNKDSKQRLTEAVEQLQQGT